MNKLKRSPKMSSNYIGVKENFFYEMKEPYMEYLPYQAPL